ncbi:MAG: YbhB/YbcL family Raf kinase inhibitor-like protein, partial [Caldimonas sp.]
MLEKLPDALGHALRGQRAGLDKIAFQAVDLRAGMASIAVASLAFADHAPIPAQYTADGGEPGAVLQGETLEALAQKYVIA